MEHPGNIILSEDLPLLRSEYANQTRHTLMHEIAHQWAGNRTTLAEAHDFAWKEAIAEYRPMSMRRGTGPRTPPRPAPTGTGWPARPCSIQGRRTIPPPS
ncbi:M1 family aminopeptidase [Cystobacter fuscus]